ncbi:MAG: CBS domain-containing protein [Candidatus Omnitrophica bacterium]|nr:CBS domain-containing protein [Candidatus Omnitrophota bacterium]
MKTKCPTCGHENIAGSDRCGKCLHSLTQKDVPQPTREKLQKLIMTERVSDFISKVPPILVGPKTPIREVIERMQALPTKGCVLVCDDQKKLVGIASIRDILLKVAGVIQEKDLASTPVEKIMTPRPECLEKDAPLAFALHKMSIGKFRHVPVLDHGIPIGVVSTRDIIEYLSADKKK